MTASLLALIQLVVPPPRGYVNDFAGVLDPATASRLDSTIAGLRAGTGAEIAVVTLRDLGGRSALDVAIQIGREWGVGARVATGDARRNLGVVILLKPLENGRRGTGDLFIATGRGAEGVLPDSRVGRIRDAMIPYLAREEYGAGLMVGVDLVGAALAEAGAGPAPRLPGREISQTVAVIVVVAFILLVLLGGMAVAGMAGGGRRGRRWRPHVWMGGWSGGGRGGGWGGGRGGGFGGGFGGFGGGGGFSGGGAGGRF